VPMTTATASSMRLPRERKFRKPFTYMTPYVVERPVGDPCRDPGGMTNRAIRP
jgi:hypothetical protein